MNLIKLLFKLRKNLKRLGNEQNIVVELSKNDNRYVIKKMYTQDKKRKVKISDAKIGNGVLISDGGLFINDFPTSEFAKAVEPEVTRIQKDKENIEARFR